MWQSPLDLQTKIALQCLHVLYFSLVVFYDQLFSDIFLCIAYTILNCFFPGHFVEQRNTLKTINVYIMLSSK